MTNCCFMFQRRGGRGERDTTMNCCFTFQRRGGRGERDTMNCCFTFQRRGGRGEESYDDELLLYVSEARG